MLCALIMAGGKGTRFWPLSTEKKPKQFLNLLGEETMIQMTVNRLKKLMSIDRIFVVTGAMYKDLVKEQLPELQEKNIILEPAGRNTAPCIALSAMLIDKYYKDATIAVVPSDHLIADEEEFLNILSNADSYIGKNEDAIITLGITPNRPETGYGYINYGDTVEKVKSHEIKAVSKFVEKPSLELAKRYLEVGNYLWNSGMFVWKISNILKLSRQYMSETYEILREIAVTEQENFENKLNEMYPKVESISVDYAIMEKAPNICVIPGDFGWDDIGTWEAIERYREKDCQENIFTGDIKCINSNNNIVIAKDKPIVIIGMNDIFCIETEDRVFIGKKEDINKLKTIKEKHRLA